jgi:hypothetical protein
MAGKARRGPGGRNPVSDESRGGVVPANVTDLGAYRQWRRDAGALRQALDHLDAAGLCACWILPRPHPGRVSGGFAATGTGAP